MSKTPPADTWTAALLRAQQAAQQIPKRGYNKFHKFYYVVAGDAVTYGKDILNAQGIVLLVSSVSVVEMNGETYADRNTEKHIIGTGYGRMSAKLMHGGGCAAEISIECPFNYSDGRPPDKSFQAIVSTMEGRMYRLVLGVSGDDDGIEGRDDSPAPQQRQRKSQTLGEEVAEEVAAIKDGTADTSEQDFADLVKAFGVDADTLTMYGSRTDHSIKGDTEPPLFYTLTDARKAEALPDIVKVLTEDRKRLKNPAQNRAFQNTLQQWAGAQMAAALDGTKEKK